MIRRPRDFSLFPNTPLFRSTALYPGPRTTPPAVGDPSLEPLPTSVHESLAALEADERLRDLLGDEFVAAYTVMRRHELQRFDDHVTDWELDEYVEVF